MQYTFWQKKGKTEVKQSENLSNESTDFENSSTLNVKEYGNLVIVSLQHSEEKHKHTRTHCLDLWCCWCLCMWSMHFCWYSVRKRAAAHRVTYLADPVVLCSHTVDLVVCGLFVAIRGEISRFVVSGKAGRMCHQIDGQEAGNPPLKITCFFFNFVGITGSALGVAADEQGGLVMPET